MKKPYYKILLIIFIALPVMIIGATVWFLQSNNQLEAELIKLNDIQEKIVDQIDSDEDVLESIETLSLEANGAYTKTRTALLSGYTLGIQNDAQASEEKYQQLLLRKRRDLTQSIAYYNLGILAEGRGDLTAANEFFQSVIDLDFYDRLSLQARAYYNIARNLEKIGTIDSAIDMYEHIIEQYPDSVWVALATNRIIILR